MPNPTCAKCGHELDNDAKVVDAVHAYHPLCFDQLNRDKEQKTADLK